jgi:hypothetical protein
MMPKAEAYVMRLVERATSLETIEGRRCFGCGGEPSTGHGEHVVPLWLQRRFGLFDQRLTLLNGTTLPYRNLTVPCCEECNNGFLRNLEDKVITFVDGTQNIGDRDRLTIVRWLCKIFLGILVKESSLAVDRQDASQGMIVPASFLVEEFNHAQLILQSARKVTKFRCLHGESPCTLYIYKIFADSRFGNFDLSTNLIGQSIAIRLGRVGLIFVNDGGLQLEVGKKGPFDLDGRELHPLQFSEVAARVHYKAALRDATHQYLDVETPDLLSVEQIAVRPFTNILVEGGAMRIFRPWDDVECAGFIARYRRLPLDAVYDEATGLFSTVLHDNHGELLGPDHFTP